MKINNDRQRRLLRYLEPGDGHPLAFYPKDNHRNRILSPSSPFEILGRAIKGERRGGNFYYPEFETIESGKGVARNSKRES